MNSINRPTTSNYMYLDSIIFLCLIEQIKGFHIFVLQKDIIAILFFHFVSLLLCITVNFYSHAWTEPPLPVYYQYFLESECVLLKDTKGTGRYRTPNLLLQSPTR